MGHIGCHRGSGAGADCGRHATRSTASAAYRRSGQRPQVSSGAGALFGGPSSTELAGVNSERPPRVVGQIRTPPPPPPLHLGLYLASQVPCIVKPCLHFCMLRLCLPGPSAAVRSAALIAGVGCCPHQQHPESDSHADHRLAAEASHGCSANPPALICQPTGSLVHAAGMACLRRASGVQTTAWRRLSMHWLVL